MDLPTDPIRDTRQLPADHRVRRPVRGTTAAAVAASLRDQIVGMDLLPGTSLNDRQLGERFGVSRTPIREALLRLADEGLVEIFPQSGTIVSRIPVGAIPEALAIRQALEAVSVEGSAARRAVDGLDAALGLQRGMAARNELRGFHEADEAFHEALAAGSGYPGVWRLLRSAKVQIDRARRLTLPAPGRMDQVIAEHQRIRDACAQGDSAAARLAMRDHLSIVIPDVTALRQRFPAYFIDA
ncbi:GntR family transcriptional regulator [Lichenihabitans sp. Uapishka_5]|uniref:GntR family transcriptional regulator n=1 Tax=Lichenihabitans sp. Uapishka_5 TaxID=3037302 RepID=UPI0029E80824|nr:GntR family transcriptional regulator [Lichenihabitans sp. Uapishka_5]MDX7950527.1 GntR family transcriptional regulator [Lichenihabitans sp. Uapishka_5]